MRLRWEYLPERVVTGVFMIHSGWGKLRADEERAAGVHGMAVGTYPQFGKVSPKVFAKALGAGEIGLGALLLAPTVPTLVAGSALTAFSGGLIGLYWKTPGMREPGSIWPTPQGTALAKDSWLVGIGAGMVLGGLRPSGRRGRLEDRRKRKAARRTRHGRGTPQ
jgi:uncharacterized membrane protein YphA (DoxX/SURF4 family)